MKTKILVITLFLLTGAVKAETVATIGDIKINKKQLDSQTKQVPNITEAQKKQVLQQLIDLEVLKQEAIKQKINEDEDIKIKIAHQTAQTLVSELLKKKFKDYKPDEATLKAAYEKKIKTMPKTEYKASHILLKDEKKAIQIIKELETGKDFSALAKEHSTGPTGKNGGDLGWFPLKTMVPEFGSALKNMKKDEYSQKPVKTQFGWHIIKLTDTRKLVPPKLEELKEELTPVILNDAVGAYIKSIKDKAKIVIK
jgi:peptidyl-prolyl cis-trans isomerase C